MILLHSCCADCTIKLLESIEKETNFKSKDIVLFFYNPNIHPRSELLSRQRALKKMYKDKYKIVIGDWRPEVWFEKITQKIPDKTKAYAGMTKDLRCPKCWELRLEKTFQYAKENEFEIVSSTLSSSMYQDFAKIKEIGENLAKKYEVDFWVPEKINRQKETKGFYKQNYCGCCLSLMERMMDKFKI